MLPAFLLDTDARVRKFRGVTGVGNKFEDEITIRVSDQVGMSSQRQGQASYRNMTILCNPGDISFRDYITITDKFTGENVNFRVVSLTHSNPGRTSDYTKCILEEWHWTDG